MNNKFIIRKIKKERIWDVLTIISYLFILFLAIKGAYARDYFFSVSTGIRYANINEDNYEFVDKYEELTKINSINLGVSYTLNDYILSAFSNRFYNTEIEREVRQISSGLIFTNKSKIITDGFLIGKLFGKFSPAFMLINLKLKKSSYYDNVLVGRSIDNSILKGINLSYYTDKNISFSVYYILPEDEIFLESGFGANISFNF